MHLSSYGRGPSFMQSNDMVDPKGEAAGNTLEPDVQDCKACRGRHCAHTCARAMHKRKNLWKEGTPGKKSKHSGRKDRCGSGGVPRPSRMCPELGLARMDGYAHKKKMDRCGNCGVEGHKRTTCPLHSAMKLPAELSSLSEDSNTQATLKPCMRCRGEHPRSAFSQAGWQGRGWCKGCRDRFVNQCHCDS